MTHKHLVHILQGSGWEIGRLATPQPGDPADRASIAYTAVTTSSESFGDGSLSGRFHRMTLRNRIPEASRATYFEAAMP